MKLLTKALEKQIPPLLSTEDVPLGERVAVAKYFTPWGSYTFYVVEGGEEENDYIFWGLVTGLVEDEFGYSSLKEMESVRGFGGLGIERDLYFKPRKISDIKEIPREVWEIREDEQ